ncbi:serine hydrolase [Enterococcus hulanensis]|uniref:phage tail tip lysozyme n=1 Tax=Enterococcus hulanensis TaxID=2559929 RepID=UPI001A8FCAC2|nr:phage tail tip lysozyme [Enterococcus hulanensis]MBO0456593.1 serine hydrolase [Enterococcus hulanensis]
MEETKRNRGCGCGCLGCLIPLLIVGFFFMLSMYIMGVDEENHCQDRSSMVSVDIDNAGSEENAKAIYDFFISELNATPQGAAGPMGCMDFESGGFNPGIENSSSGAFGLAQWLGSRKEALRAFAAEKGKEMSNLGVQLEFLKKELENPYYAKAKAALQLNDVHEAQHQWLLWFEGLSQDSSQWHSEERNARADKWFAKFGSNNPISSVAMENAAKGQLESLAAECTSATTGDGGDILEVAKSLIGYFSYSQENRTSFGNPLNPKKSGQADCSSFVWLVLTKAGYKTSQVAWATPSMTSDARGAKQYLQEIPEREAKAGDIIVVNLGAGFGNDGHTAILAENWHGNTTKIIEMGGYGADSVHEGQVDTSFGYLLAGDICFARAVGVPTGGNSKGQKGNFKALDQLNKSAGKVAYGIYYFDDKKYLSNNNNEPMISASVIKVFIMEYLYYKGRTGETAGSQSVQSLIERMITVSDNDATNILIDHVGMETLNKFFSENGYSNTKLQRKMLAQGNENYTSLQDCMNFLRKLYENQGNPKHSAMLETMKRQQIRSKIPSQLDVPVANKTGELPTVENDVGIVFSNRPYAIVVLTNNVSNSQEIRTGIGNLALEAKK